MAEYNDDITKVANELKMKYGILAPENSGLIGGLWKNTAKSFVSGVRGVGSTLEASGFDNVGGSLREWGEHTLSSNQHWNPGPNEGVDAMIGRFIGSYFYITFPLFFILIYVFLKKYLPRFRDRIKLRKTIRDQKLAEALTELESGNPEKSAWAQAIMEAKGDEAKAKAIYIKIKSRQW